MCEQYGVVAVPGVNEAPSSLPCDDWRLDRKDRQHAHPGLSTLSTLHGCNTHTSCSVGQGAGPFQRPPQRAAALQQDSYIQLLPGNLGKKLFLVHVTVFLRGPLCSTWVRRYSTVLAPDPRPTHCCTLCILPRLTLLKEPACHGLL